MECPNADHMTHLLKKEPSRIPINGTFELTIRCNLHCKMCMFRHDDSENTDIVHRELTADQWIKLANEVSRAGTFSLLLTGGEPMLRSDFCELYEGIYKQGFILTLYTNATLVTPRIMETLRRYPPHRIGITIYGASSETYERVCADASSFDRMREGVKQLRSLPSILDFRTTVINDNYADVDAIETMLRTEFGESCRLTQARMVNRSVRGACADVDACRLEPEDNVRLALRRSINIIKSYVGDRYDEKYLAIRLADNSDAEKHPRLTLFGCDAGMDSYAISWDGKLLGCQMMGAFALDVLDGSFTSAWKRFPGIVKLPPLNETCQACESLGICNCCWASRLAETGDLGGCPEYVCRDTAIVRALLNK